MESYQIRNRSEIKKSKKINVQDTKSKSVKTINNPLIILIMKTLRNKVQLIGNVGENPKVHTFESGKKVSRFTLATNEFFLKDGEKIQQTQWHTLVAWEKQADFVEKFIAKGSEIAVDGKLTYRSFENEAGEKQYITEILVSEILLLGSKQK